jgi:hypothetical protein
VKGSAAVSRYAEDMKIPFARLVLGSTLALLAGCAVEPAAPPGAEPPGEADVAAVVDRGASHDVHTDSKATKCYDACMRGAGRNPTWGDVQFCAYSCL